MKKNALLISIVLLSIIFISGTIDLNNLDNYANQTIPAYITKDNMPTSNPITDEGATLGRVLFYDKKLSSDNSISCASCHQQQFAFSDMAELSQGVNGETQRHSMRLVNIRFGDETKFRWDESALTLEEQMTKPIKHFDEMGYSGTNGAPNFTDLLNELDTVSYYNDLFTAAFGDTIITEDRIQKALAQFVRSIQSFDSKYDIGRAQVSSDTVDFPNFTPQENAGKTLFIDTFAYVTDTITVVDAITGEEEEHAASRRISGGFNCATCHRPPEFDIDPASLNNGFIRGNPAQGIPFDLTVTRTPTLKDLVKADGSVNGGMFHAGQAMNLFGITAHYDFRQIEPINNNLDARYTPGGLPQWLDITPQEQIQLFAFMRTLAGSNVYTDSKWSDPFDANGNITVIPLTPLPIELLSFNAKLVEEKIVLNWVTATEINNDYFSIEKLSDGNNWKEIGQINGSGDSNVENSYQYIDSSPHNGLNYYRLKQVDFDGRFTFSDIEAVSFETALVPSVQVYPNPVLDKLIVKGNIEISMLQVFDLSGMLLTTLNPTSNDFEVEFAKFPKGVYLVKGVSFLGKNVLTQKVVKF